MAADPESFAGKVWVLLACSRNPLAPDVMQRCKQAGAKRQQSQASATGGPSLITAWGVSLGVGLPSKAAQGLFDEAQSSSPQLT